MIGRRDSPMELINPTRILALVIGLAAGALAAFVIIWTATMHSECAWPRFTSEILSSTELFYVMSLYTIQCLQILPIQWRENICTATASLWKAQINSLLISDIDSGMFVPTVTGYLQAWRNLKSTKEKTIHIRQMEAIAWLPYLD